ncbi:hypothetical protein COH20_001072 [Aspergillus flavus]|nr:hypothetical protein COH20_001072 [Aspergillus flavus]
MSSLLAEQAAEVTVCMGHYKRLFMNQNRSTPRLTTPLRSSSTIINVTMAPLSKSKSYTDLITSMGVGDSEPDEERILTTLARHMAKVGVFESGLTKHMNQVR